MKLSQVPKEKLASLTVAEKTRIVYGGDRVPTTGHGIAALVLGAASPQTMAERAAGAAALYREGLVPCAIPTGGVVHPTELGDITEADYMARRLRDAGVPDEAILVENQARTTIENLLLGAVLMECRFHPHGGFPVYVVTSAWHMRRSLALAENFLPRTARILCRIVERIPDEPHNWHRDEYLREKIDRELHVSRQFIEFGHIPDIEF